ncbi:MAG: hypothetical protein HZA77_04230 [Candidatus Schekmanbacteria bacterium]|nr:hypothetical protein [Candidatus Schekmanbacteria bacterium]
MSTEKELGDMLKDITNSSYDIAQLREDIIDKIEGRSEPTSLLSKIRKIAGREPLSYPRFVPLFMRFWDSIDRALKEKKQEG